MSGVADKRALGDDLISGAGMGDLDLVRSALAAGIDVLTFGGRALFHAALWGSAEVLRELLDDGIDVHAEHDKALLFAVSGGRADNVQVLLAARANVPANNGSALKLAADNGYTQVVRLLLNAGALERDSALAKAVRMRLHQAAGLLFSAGTRLSSSTALDVCQEANLQTLEAAAKLRSKICTGPMPHVQPLRQRLLLDEQATPACTAVSLEMP